MKKLFLLILLLLCQQGFSQNIIQVEYWFGDNFNGKMPAPVSLNANNELFFDVSFLDNGTNELNEYFHCRFKDNAGNWSCIYSQQMINTIDISTSVVKVQYWFDINPINGNPLQTINNVLVSGELDHQWLNIDWPQNAQEIHYRFKSAYNQWSSIQSNNLDAVVYENNQIVKVEYWFGDNFDDRLPPQSVTANATNEIIFDFPYPDNGTNQLNETVHYRFQDGIGNWSAIFSEQMINNAAASTSLVQVQYWFDDNAIIGSPEFTINNVIVGGELDHQWLNIDWPQNAQEIHYRFKSPYNQWSSIQSNNLDTVIYQNNKIVEVEYWFDENFIERASLPVQADQNNEISLEFPYVVNGIVVLTDKVHYRFRDGIGNWSSIQSTTIDEIENRNNKIVEIEWWLNDDFTNKIPITVNQNEEEEFYLDIRELTLNNTIENTIHVRYKDKMNRWSSIFSFFPNEPGITVLVHGFQALGELSDSTADFKKMGASILNRAGGGVMYKNNPDNGQIEIVSNTGENQYPFDNSHEIVLVYDWRDLSNNNVSQSDFGGNGYLESAADNLFATIIKLGNHLYPTSMDAVDKILAKPMHFIAHSRGNIVTLQFLHRLATYFPETKVEQFTLLDPHPATAFGDLNTENPISPPNLPCVYGIGTICGSNGCIDGNSVFLKIPSNVTSADNYFRYDNEYEGIGGVSSFFSFDGVRVLDLGSFNRILNESVLVVGANNLFGGTHSAVHEWYRGTIRTDENVAKESIYPWLSAQQTTNMWYSTAMTSGQTNNFLETENRFTTGFNRSRIGGGEPVPEIPNESKESLTEMNRSIAKRYGLSLTDYPDGVALHTVFGGYFDTNNNAGWEKNGGFSTNVLIENGKAKIPYDASNPGILQHSLMYFSDNYNFLKVNVYDALFSSIKITFFNSENSQLGMPIINLLNNGQSEQYFQIPNQLKGKVGTFQIEYISNNFGSFKVDEIKLSEFGEYGSCGDTTTWVVTPENTNGVWTNGIPNYETSAIISSDFTSSIDIEACTLTVNSGANVTFNSDHDLKLNGAIKVNSGTFTLENNASLIQNSTEFANVGNIVVKRNTNALMRLDYTIWSSPVASQNLLEFSPNTITNRFYTYNPNTDLYQTIIPSSNTFAAANGYLIRMPNNHPTSPTIWEGNFTGVPHNGRFNLDVQDGTYNAIGNPYPSPIKADLFISENNLTEAIYFWRKTNNSINPSYATYTLAGGTGTKANIGGGSDIIPNGIIQTGQGFIAKATSSRLSFQNYMRFANNENQFFRTEQDKSRIWLNLTNPSGFFCQTMFGYMPNATDEIDAAIDGHFLINEPIHLCSIINNEEFVIQGKAPFEVSDIIPLGFKTNVAGNYQIKIDHLDGLFLDGQEIYLKDNLLNIEHELTENPYIFTTEIGIFNSRFEIVYQSTLSTDIPLENNNIVVYKQNEIINVDAGNKNIKSITVYDLRGRLIFEKNYINERHFNFKIETANQILLIKVETDDELILTKKIIN